MASTRNQFCMPLSLPDYMYYLPDNIKPFEKDWISELRDDLLLEIFRYLNVEGLFNCSQVCTRWQRVASDCVLYRHLSLNSHCYLDHMKVVSFLTKRCKVLKKLKYTFIKKFIFKHKFDGDYKYWEIEDYHVDLVFEMLLRFFQKCCQELTHLTVHFDCDFDILLVLIGKCKKLTHLHFTIVFNLNTHNFLHLLNLNALVSLDLPFNEEVGPIIEKVLIKNPNLEHLGLNYFEIRSVAFDRIIYTITKNNPRIKSLKFDTGALTVKGAELLSQCVNLRELDCTNKCLIASPENCIIKIARKCSKLEKLKIAVSSTTEEHLLPVARYMKNLTVLDVSDMEFITPNFCQKALENLPKLQTLSVCRDGAVSSLDVEEFRREYPNVKIKVI